ncbi:response regulator transcription factor [Sphaerobacter thermophilus]|uniref:response regulator transcription factor n=1 Tax=Sphaerobacter thermophilus TaxID=2057 RepID=UPI000DB800E9|nr:MAG: DNA-binding response regulator [Sphaerobacter thermophilus]
MSGERVRVVVADDHDLFREGLRQLLETVPSVEIVGEAADGQQAIELVANLDPDVVLMDINMPRMDGIRATEFIVKHYPRTAVVVLTMYQDDEYAIHAIRAGAKSYLLKNSRSEEVIEAIHVAASGGSTIDPALAPALMREYQRLLTRTPTNTRQQLTQRELTLLRLLANGYNNRQIAEQLQLAESTVKNNLSALFQKIGVRDRTQAVLFAISQGLVPKPTENS